MIAFRVGDGILRLTLGESTEPGTERVSALLYSGGLCSKEICLLEKITHAKGNLYSP